MTTLPQSAQEGLVPLTKNNGARPQKILWIATAIILAVCLLTMIICNSSLENFINNHTIDAPTGKAPAPLDTPLQEGWAQLDNITMHYYTIGEGHPLVLIHGNTGDYSDLANLGRRLAHDYKVYIVEDRCHGQSTKTETITYDLMAGDIAQFCIKMNMYKPIAVGLSDGGINALVMAINYPNLLGGVVAFGANSSPDGLTEDFVDGVKADNARNHTILNDLMLLEPHITQAQLQSITTPVHLVFGEFDIVRHEDIKFLAQNIPNAQLTILRGGNHTNYVFDGTISYQFVEPFIQMVAQIPTPIEE